MSRSPERALIVLLGAIGDVVRGLPLASALRRAFPSARISWAVEPTSRRLVERHPAIDQVLVFQRDRGARGFLSFLLEVRRQRFDLVLDLQRHLKSGVVSMATGASRRIGFARENAREGNWLFNNERIPLQPHLSSKLSQFLTFAEALGIPSDPSEFGLQASADERARVSEALREVKRPIVAAFIGSTWESRWWSSEATAAVLTECQARYGLDAVLLGGPSERKLAEAIVDRAPFTTVDLVGRTSLGDLVAIFERAKVAFGPDSGPMHIAAATSIPVVSLWGPTSPLRSAPQGSEPWVIVGEADCHPCYLRDCPIGKICMESITPAIVLDRIGEALDLASDRP